LRSSLAQFGVQAIPRPFDTFSQGANGVVAGNDLATAGRGNERLQFTSTNPANGSLRLDGDVVWRPAGCDARAPLRCPGAPGASMARLL
jgi:hypothetical protein